jgi:hypothetical protein
LRAEEPDVLQNLLREHPRLYCTATDWKSLKKQIDGDRVLHFWFDFLADKAEYMMPAPPLLPPSPPESVSGTTANMIDERMTLFAGIYRLTGDRLQGECVKQEVLAICKYSDWNPEGFLACAAMMHAAAVGYDWGYDLLSPDERATVRKSIIEKGLKPGLEYYRRNRRWANRGGNWCGVCNGGMIVAALAIADEEPELAREVLTKARKNLQHALAQYNPDGGWSEGPGYWSYGTSRTVRAIAALESALGTDLDIKKTPGFAETGNFHEHTTGPFNYIFTFSDCGEVAYPEPSMFWFARQYQRPEYAIHERQVAEHRPEIFHLIWSGGSSPPPKLPANFERDALFRNVDVACFRSAWEDPSATYVGFRCGYDNHGHGHLDYGSFILESQQERWAIDLGAERYGPAYFSSKRWTFYRARNESHNTLTINGGIQNSRIRSPIVAFLSTPDHAYAVGDLSKTFGLPDQAVRRGIALLNRRDVLVQDDLASAEPLDVVWNMFTRADVALDGQRATLTLRGAKMFARILSPADATFEIASAEAPPEQTQQPDVRSLRIHIRTKAPAERIAVLLSPMQDVQPSPLQPLSQWIKASPVK